MSYNSAYRQDDKPNMAASTLAYTQATLNQITRTFLSSPPPPPPFGDSLVDFTSLNQTALYSIGSDWTQIKYLPGGSTRWFPGNNNLLSYTGTEFLFTTGNFSRWLICDKSQVNGEYYADAPRIIKRSSISAVPYTARWYYRAPGSFTDEDPWVSLEDIWDSITAGTMMYGENGIVAFIDSIHPTGMYVFTR